MWYDKTTKYGELTIVDATGAEDIIKIADWRSVHYLFAYCDKTIDKKNYVKDIINPYLAHSKDDQIAQSISHFGMRAKGAKPFIFRIEADDYLWCQMTVAWKPVTINAIKGLLPSTAWEMTSIEPTERHGGKITYNMMFPDSVTAIVEIDAGLLNGRSAMNIKGKLFGEIGEVIIDEKKKYRHTDISKIGEGLTETLQNMGRLHDTIPNLMNITYHPDMLGKNKLSKEISSKLTSGISVYHVLQILRDAGKKAIAGTILLNCIPKVLQPVDPNPVQTVDPIPVEPEIEVTPIPE